MLFSFEKIDVSWRELFPSLGKWAITVIIKTIIIALSIVAVTLIVKYTGIKNMVLQDILEIKPKSSDVISSPNINYDKDLNSIDSVLKMMESKKSNTKEKTK